MRRPHIASVGARQVSAFLGVLWLAGLGEVHDSEAQQEPAVLRVTTRMVEVQVLVHDKQGKPVSGLSKDDFVLTDRGQRQKITLFAVESNRTSPPPQSPLPANVFSNLLPRGKTPATTATVVLFDKLNTRTEDQNYARRELVKFLKQAGPEERIAIVSLDNDLHILAGFSAESQARLNAAAADQGPTRVLL